MNIFVNLPSDCNLCVPLYLTQVPHQTLARHQLRNTTLPVKVVAVNAGFTSLSAFSRAFSQLTGKTPSEYRAEQG